MFLKKLNIKARLIVIFLIIGLAPLIIVGTIGIIKAQKALSEKSFSQLTSIREVKSVQIQNHFEDIWNDISFLATNPTIIEALTEYEKGFMIGLDSPEYKSADFKYSSLLEHFKMAYGYYDLFLITKDGDIVYTVIKEPDFGTNLITGEYSNQSIARLYKLAKQVPAMVDYDFYTPSNGVPAAFIAAPLKDSGGQALGIVAVQLSIESIDRILHDRHGMTETMEVYLLGQDNTMRSNPSNAEGTTILTKAIETETAAAGLSGQSGVKLIRNIDNIKVLSAYAPLKVNGMQWAIIAEVHADEAFAMANSMLVTSIIFGIVTAILVALLGWWVARSFSRPIEDIAKVAVAMSEGNINQEINYRATCEIGILAESFRRLILYIKEISSVMERISNRDLTVEIIPRSNQDVLGKSFQIMHSNFNNIIKQLNYSADQLVGTAAELSSMSEQMSTGTSQQIQQISQVSASINEIASTIIQTSQNAVKASELSMTASETAEDGSVVVQETILGMYKITESAAHASGVIGKLALASDKIAEIIGVIDDIADQTNLLALNAAIEAARAGDQGRGFAVVADEVRKLAERTAHATGEITDMIKGIQHDSNSAVIAMQEAGNSVDMGQGLANRAGDSLHNILGVVQNVMDMIQQIAVAAEQQSATAEQISHNVENISSVTLDTASGAKQTARAAERLNTQAEALQSIVAGFKLIE